MRIAHWHRNAALVAPLLLVNAAAIYGQSGWAWDHLGHNWVVAVLFALAVESIGVFLAAEAHAALMAGHAAGALRIGSYAVGALVGTLNYAHYATQPGYHPNPLAVTFGLLSSISPWLWAIRSRSMNRERLADMGLIDPRAVKFSRLRWLLFPARTFTAFRHAVWAGISRPDEAVAAADQHHGRRMMPAPLPPLLAVEDDSQRLPVDTDTDMAVVTGPAVAVTAQPLPDPGTSPAAAERAPRRAPRRATKRQPSAAERVAKAVARSPQASDATIAARLDLSEATVRRHRRHAVDSLSTTPGPNTGLPQAA